MKKEILIKTFAFAISFLMIAGMLMLPVFAENSEAVVEETVEPYVILTADDMKDKLSNENGCTSYSFEKEGGFEFLRLAMKTDGNDPYISYTPGDYSADDYKYISVLTRANIYNTTAFSLYYSTEGNGKIFEHRSRVSAFYQKMSNWQFLVYDFTELETWSGMIDKIRLDFFEGTTFATGTYSDVAAVIMSTTVEGIYDAAFEVITEMYPPVQAFSDFTEADLPCVNGSPVNTAVTVDDGNLIYMASGSLQDPSAWFYYADLAQARGVKEFTTEDFRYTVIRYRTTMNFVDTGMELFILTGDAKSLMDMIRIENTYSCHSGYAKYLISRTWRGVMVDMAEDDGRAENTRLLYGWQGRGKFTGFRFDWCGTGTASSYMEVSDFMFYKDKQAAEAVSGAISTINIHIPIEIDEEIETEKIIMPWETETETDTTEETLPVFTEETEEQNTEVVTEITDESNTESPTLVETETETETENNSSGNNGEASGDNWGGIDIGGDEEPVETGSQMPFYIACGVLAGLSLASIATVVVIRIKCKV